MKTLFISFQLLFISIAGLAQIQRYTFAVSSNFSYDKENFERFYNLNNHEITNEMIRVEPKIGFFLSKRFCVGGLVSYTWNERSGSTIFDDGLTKKTFGRGAFVRYYQPIVKDLYGIVGVGYLWNKQTTEHRRRIDPNYGGTVTIEEELKGNSFQKGIGLAYFISNSIAIELMGDHFNKIEDHATNQVGFFGSFESKFSLSAGLQVYISKRSK